MIDNQLLKALIRDRDLGINRSFTLLFLSRKKIVSTTPIWALSQDEGRKTIKVTKEVW